MGGEISSKMEFKFSKTLQKQFWRTFFEKVFFKLHETFEESSAFNKIQDSLLIYSMSLLWTKGEKKNKHMDQNSLQIYLQINILNTFYLLGKNAPTFC